ncbi:hypothetical protein [Streptomyces lavendulae]|uniref:hypothetical protein n=1 Tax=Streptomyces lavendulae TaxID=1914 RepID=UPI0004C0B184|nr:hypothetical protein [Streptomyces lavendulae]
MAFTSDDTPITASLDLIAEHVASIWSDCPTDGPTHLHFQTAADGAACALRPVHRTGRGYVPVEHRPGFDLEGWMHKPWLPWEELGAELEKLVGQQTRHPALARESGGAAGGGWPSIRWVRGPSGTSSTTTRRTRWSSTPTPGPSTPRAARRSSSAT